MRILIVDDEPMIGIAAAAALNDAGYIHVDVADTLTKATDLVAAQTYAAAVLDTNLAGVSVTPVANALREKNVPFLILSGYSGPQLAETFPNVPYLTKPYEEDDLIAHVKKLAPLA